MRFVQKVHDIMKFREESLYIAANIADRYLENLTAQPNFNPKESPCLMTLAVTSILLASKLTSQKSVCYAKMLSLFKKTKGLSHITKDDLVKCESKILFALDWDLNSVSPITLLERYQRIFGVDREEED